MDYKPQDLDKKWQQRWAASRAFEVTIDPGLKDGGDLLIDIADGTDSRADAAGRHCLYLDGYAYKWFRVGGLDYLLKRTEV